MVCGSDPWKSGFSSNVRLSVDLPYALSANRMWYAKGRRTLVYLTVLVLPTGRSNRM